MAGFCVHPVSSTLTCCASSYPRGKAENARRVFVGAFPLTCTGSTILLSEAEIAHLRASRARAGATVTLLNDDGASAQAVLDASRKSVTVTEPCVEVENLLRRPRLSLALCVPRSPSRADWAVEKLAEIGVHTTYFASRSVRMQYDASVQRRIERWRRLATAAAKQSLSTRVMTVESIDGTLEDIVKDVQHRHSSVLLCSPSGNAMIRELNNVDASNPLVLVGPEGGLTDEEEEQLKAIGAVPVSLGESRLRLETASVFASASIASFQYSQEPR